jgi:hypothetical protein
MGDHHEVVNEKTPARQKLAEAAIRISPEVAAGGIGIARAAEWAFRVECDTTDGNQPDL